MSMSNIRLRWLYLRGPFLWCGLACSALGVILIVAVGVTWKSDADFERRALPATATVTGKDTRLEKTTRDGKPTMEVAHHVTYTFRDLAGREVRHSAKISPQQWAQSRKGNRLAIQYDRENPSDSRLVGAATPSRWGLLLFGVAGAVLASAGVGMVSYALFSASGRVHLVRDGTPVLGVLDEIAENDAAFKAAGTYRLLYHYTDESGETWEGAGPPQPWSLAARWNPGESILVLYDPQNPRHSEADVFETRNGDLEALLASADQDAE